MCSHTLLMFPMLRRCHRNATRAFADSDDGLDAPLQPAPFLFQKHGTPRWRARRLWRRHARRGNAAPTTPRKTTSSEIEVVKLKLRFQFLTTPATSPLDEKLASPPSFFFPETLPVSWPKTRHRSGRAPELLQCSTFTVHSSLPDKPL